MSRIRLTALVAMMVTGAAHLANAGVPTLLLDIVPKDNTETRPPGRVEGPDRNAIARGALEAAKKAKPAAFFTADRASLVSIGPICKIVV